MRGAAYLSGYGDKERKAAIVVDVGGTTTDIGVLLPSGLPRKASAYVEGAGVQVNYELPHLHSIGLGGGSIVRVGDKVTVGPASVGHELEKSIVFGGDTTTATDVAVAARARKGGALRMPCEASTRASLRQQAGPHQGPACRTESMPSRRRRSRCPSSSPAAARS